MCRTALFSCTLGFLLAAKLSAEDSTCSKPADAAAHALLQTRNARERSPQDFADHGRRHGRVTSKAPGIGLTASLDEKGFSEVAGTCCNIEMLSFFQRTVDSLEMEVCDKAGLERIVPWFTCEKAGPDSWPYTYDTGSFAELQEVLLRDIPPKKCAYVAPTGTCHSYSPEDGAECENLGQYKWNWGGYCTKAGAIAKTSAAAEAPTIAQAVTSTAAAKASAVTDAASHDNHNI